MDQAALSSEAKEAYEILVEISDALDQIDKWLDNEVNKQLNDFIDRWQQLCKSTANIHSNKFVQHARKIIEDIDPFQQQLVSKAQVFSENARDRLSIVRELAQDDAQVQKFQSNILLWWNDAQQPRITMFFNKSCELEKDIQNMIEVAMKPAK